ncbi:MAG TPA: STAS domain-containing protein [Thermoanaerobaculia bacterium]|jgi:anti-sigma B factor antagonist
MEVEVRKAGDVIVVDLRGRLIAGTGEELLHEVMDELVAEGWKKILLNLTEVPRIDSAGIGELVAGVRLAKRLGSTVKVWLAGGRVRNVLELSQILPVLDIYDNEHDALDSFAG